MIADIGLLQAYWLFLLPFPWLWLYWRRRYSSSWPELLPTLAMRYPLLNDIAIGSSKEAKKKKIFTADQSLVIAMTFMILALSQPVLYRGLSEQEKKSEPVDMILVVDTALSMSLSDYELEGQPVSRLGIARLLLNQFVKNYSGSRMGLVILANPPALWLPLTSDKVIVQDAISRINTFIGGRISDMGATLNLIREQFNDHQEKVVVLISDGGAQIGAVAPEIAAKELASEGFTLYVIAIGSADPEAKSLDNSSLIYEAVNLKMLQQVADSGHGALFHALDSQAFSDALKSIENKHRKPVQLTEQSRLTQALYPLPLVIALLLFLYAALFHPNTFESESRGRNNV